MTDQIKEVLSDKRYLLLNNHNLFHCQYLDMMEIFNERLVFHHHRATGISRSQFEPLGMNNPIIGYLPNKQVSTGRPMGFLKTESFKIAMYPFLFKTIKKQNKETKTLKNEIVTLKMKINVT